MTSKDLPAIKKHYEVALSLLKLNKRTQAEREIYNRMPTNLYDVSLDILYNRNKEAKAKALKSIINKVHALLGSDVEPEEGSDIADDNQIF